MAHPVWGGEEGGAYFVKGSAEQAGGVEGCGCIGRSFFVLRGGVFKDERSGCAFAWLVAELVCARLLTCAAGNGGKCREKSDKQAGARAGCLPVWGKSSRQF